MTDRPPFHAVIALVSFCILLGTNAPIEARERDSDPGQLILNLPDALGEGKDLELYFEVYRDGLASGFALAPKYNRSAHMIESKDFELKLFRMAEGELTITLMPDPWVPKHGKPIEGRITIKANINAAEVTGGFASQFGEHKTTGNLTGRTTIERIAPRRRYDLRFFEGVPEEVSPKSKSLDKRLIHLRFDTMDGRAEAGTALHDKGGTYGIWAGTMRQFKTQIVDGWNEGHFEIVYPAVKDRPEKVYRYHYKTTVIGERQVGTYKSRRYVAGKPNGEKFTGYVIGESKHGIVEDGRSGDCRLVLDKVLGGTQPIVIYASFDREGFKRGFAVAPTFTRTPMRVDVSQLITEGRTVTGTITVDKLNPADPEAGPKVLAVTKIDMDRVPGGFDGVHQTTSYTDEGEMHTEGVINGSLHRRPIHKQPFTLNLKFEDGLTGGKQWQNRAFIGLNIDDGKITGGELHTDHPKQSKWSGEFVSGNITRVYPEYHGSFEADIATTGPVKAGRYRFEFEAYAHTAGVFGEFVTYFDGKRIKSGRLIGSVKPAQDE